MNNILLTKDRAVNPYYKNNETNLVIPINKKIISQ